MFVSSVLDNFDERIEQKLFHCEIVIDVVKVSAETKPYKPIPVIAPFKDKNGNDTLNESITANYKAIKKSILLLVQSETERIKNAPRLKHLIK